MTEYRFKNYCREIFEATDTYQLEETMSYIKDEPSDYRRALLIEMIELTAKILMELNHD
jgi:hypothetical protein